MPIFLTLPHDPRDKVTKDHRSKLNQKENKKFAYQTKGEEQRPPESSI
jgi:hypothetical protein